MKQAVIVAMGRSAIGKAPRGKLRTTRPEDLASQVLSAVVKQVPQVPTNLVDDVIVGCSFPEAEQGSNVARIIALKAGLGIEVSGQTTNRFCSSGLQTIAAAANSIMVDQNDIVIAGGVESMSAVPIGGNSNYPNPSLLAEWPQAYTPMGLTAENVALKYGITRQMQDELALRSHQLAEAAQKSGKFAQEIIPIQATGTAVENGRTVSKPFTFDQDEGIRPGITMEALAKLRTVFKVGGSVTAGNASQTSDGAAFVMLMSEEKAQEYGIKPIARFVGFAVAGVEPELMGIGPIKAIPKVLSRAGLALNDIDLIELNEAFAAQAIACVNTLGIDMNRLNVNGGAIALGHPLGCTGASLTVRLLHELRRQGKKRGMVSMCVGTGMGAAGIFEMM